MLLKLHALTVSRKQLMVNSNYGDIVRLKYFFAVMCVFKYCLYDASVSSLTHTTKFTEAANRG